jgi:hypothetical protein
MLLKARRLKENEVAHKNKGGYLNINKVRRLTNNIKPI